MQVKAPFVREEAVRFLPLAEQERIIGTQLPVAVFLLVQEVQLFPPLLRQLIT